MPIAHLNNNGTTNGATAVTVVAAPVTGAVRIIPIGGLSIYNADDVATNEWFIQLNDNSTVRIIQQFVNVALAATFKNATVITLSSTTQSLEIDMSGSANATEPDYVVSFQEIT